jgi:hypothetical protein
MLRGLRPLIALLPVQAFACSCLATYPVCREVAASDVVFIGTVESVEPAFLDPWRWRDPEAAIPIDEIKRLTSDDSRQAAARLKAIYLRLLGDLPDSEKRELEVATTRKQVEAAFSSIAAQGRRAKFRVRTLFRSPKEQDEKDGIDGKPSDKDADQETRELTVWTGQGDCAIDFQTGETYLVYAGNDEETGKLETSLCYRTKRLTDAGPDLAYLYFLREGGEQASRLEGFVTSDGRQERPKYPDRVDSPVNDVVIALAPWNGKPRYTRSASDGRFVFDGLAAGEYQVRVYDSAYPRAVKLLAGPQRIEVGEKGCAGALLVVFR